MPETSDERPYFATAAKGTEGALRDELRALRIPAVRADRGGVHFGGPVEAAMRVCFESRIAVRVLWRRGRFWAGSDAALYEGVRALDLSDVLTPQKTLSVVANVKSGALTHTGFVAQKTKDALVDAQRARFGQRSNVARDNPDVRVAVHIDKDQAELYLDLSGEALHRRGYRREARLAPIKETLAAAILRLCGWNGTQSLVDPMCGSGTFAIEAALWARNIAPGLLGRSFGFQRWASYDTLAQQRFQEIRERAQDAARPAHATPTIIALDHDQEAVQLTQKAAQRAGVTIRVQRLAIADFMGTEPPSHIVTNPPYGVRLALGSSFVATAAETFRALSGHRVSAICHDAELRHAMRKAPSQEHALWNGDLECRLYSWDL